MTNKYNNWERLEQVIKYSKLSANAFAAKIGMARSENIYHIKRGNFGISYDLAERVTVVFPEINPTWLLSGVGDMLLNTKNQHTSVPFYEGDIEQVLHPDIDAKVKMLGRYHLPFHCDCDVVVRSLTQAMIVPGTAASDLFIKRVSAEEIVQGNEYVIAFDDRVVWRKIRHVKGNPEQWRLVALDRSEHPDIVVEKSAIRAVWRVIARLAILVS